MKKIDKEKLIKKLESNEITIQSDFSFASDYIILHCNNCNIYFYRQVSYVKSDNFKCRICKGNRYFETEIAPFLLNYGYVFHQYSHNNLRSIFDRVLQFDFAVFKDPKKVFNDIPDVLIEVYEGDPHFSIKGNTLFFKPHPYDDLKLAFCQDKSIPLIQFNIPQHFKSGKDTCISYLNEKFKNVKIANNIKDKKEKKAFLNEHFFKNYPCNNRLSGYHFQHYSDANKFYKKLRSLTEKDFLKNKYLYIFKNKI